MNEKFNKEILFQDIGLLAFLASIFSVLAVVFVGGSKLMTENFVMLFITVVAIVLASFSSDIAAFVTVGSQIICYTAYKLFMLYANGVAINAISYVWLLLPLATTCSMKLFCTRRNRLELENSILREQVEKLVMIDPLTELYNLRSLYHDLPHQISYISRNKLPLTLMIVHLRYAPELQRLLSGRRFDMVKQRIAQIVQDAIRSEDRLYSVDKDGDLAVMLTCNSQGALIVRNRIHSSVSAAGAFDKIADTSIKVDVQVAYIQYNEKMESDIIGFKSQVENELQYDV